MNTKIVYTPGDADLSEAAQVLSNGGLVAFPTETVYGLGANGLDTEAAKKVYAAKGRPSDNPLILHLYSPEQAENYAFTCPLYYKLALAFMPGPLTIILPKKPVVPDEVTGGLQTVALRVPSHPVARALLEKCPFPIAAPSANLSGKPSPTTAAHVVDDMNGRIDMILDGGQSEVGVESTIVKIDGEDLTLLRPGGITPEMLAPFCANVRLDPTLEKPLTGDEKPLAPGMKYKHYAPRASVVLLDGTKGEIERYMAAKKNDDSVGLMVDEGLQARLQAKNCVCFGADLRDEAHALFSCLRAFDGMENVQTIYAPMPAKDGIGLAVYNRLIKAAGFTVLQLHGK